MSGGDVGFLAARDAILALGVYGPTRDHPIASEASVLAARSAVETLGPARDCSFGFEAPLTSKAISD